MTLPKTNEPDLEFTEVHTTLSWKSFGFFKLEIEKANSHFNWRVMAWQHATFDDESDCVKEYPAYLGKGCATFEEAEAAAINSTRKQISASLVEIRKLFEILKDVRETKIEPRARPTVTAERSKDIDETPWYFRWNNATEHYFIKDLRPFRITIEHDEFEGFKWAISFISQVDTDDGPVEGPAYECCWDENFSDFYGCFKGALETVSDFARDTRTATEQYDEGEPYC